jgi:transposase InsO family protein
VADLTTVSTETDTEHRVRPRRVLPPDRQLDNEHVERNKSRPRRDRQRTASTTRQYHREEEKSKLAHHSDAGGQHTSSRFTPHPLESGIDASVGTVGDALDNTPAETMIGSRKTQLIKPRSP